MINFPIKLEHRDSLALGVDTVDIWDGQFLGKEVSCDLETSAEPFHTKDHKPVVFQAFGGGNKIYLVRIEDIKRFLNRHFDSTLIWHNASFDTTVLIESGHKTAIFDYYDNDNIVCTKLYFQLYGLATTGKIPSESSLAFCVKTLLGLTVDKDEDIRMTFGAFYGQSYEQMPIEHTVYAALDVAYTYYLYKKLDSLVKPHDEKKTRLSLGIQVKGDLALRSIYTNGIGVDLEKKDELLNYLDDKLWGLNQKLSLYGVVKGQKGVQTAYEEAIKYIGLYDELPKTTSGVTSSTKVLEDYRHHEFIDNWCEYIAAEKQRSFLVGLNDRIIYPSYTTLLVTGRTACQAGHNGINIQQLPREGGIRDLFIPQDENNVLIDVDYDGIELSAFSQVQTTLYGSSVMGNIINSGKDTHTATAGLMYGLDTGPCTKVDMGQVTKKQRQSSKCANFGFLANMHPETFVGNAKKQGVIFTVKEAEELKERWIGAYPDTEVFFKEPFNHKDGVRWVEKEGRYKDTYRHFTLTGRKKAYCKYTEWLNCNFQGLAADGLKIALYELFKAGYKLVSEVHDNITVEVSRLNAKEELYKVSKIMIESMSKVIPDIRVGTEGRAVMHLGKDAEEIHSLNLNSQEL